MSSPPPPPPVSSIGFTVTRMEAEIPSKSIPVNFPADRIMKIERNPRKQQSSRSGVGSGDEEDNINTNIKIWIWNVYESIRHQNYLLSAGSRVSAACSKPCTRPRVGIKLEPRVFLLRLGVVLQRVSYMSVLKGFIILLNRQRRSDFHSVWRPNSTGGARYRFP